MPDMRSAFRQVLASWVLAMGLAVVAGASYFVIRAADAEHDLNQRLHALSSQDRANIKERLQATAEENRRMREQIEQNHRIIDRLVEEVDRKEVTGGADRQ